MVRRGIIPVVGVTISCASLVHQGRHRLCRKRQSPAQPRTPTTQASMPEPSWLSGDINDKIAGMVNFLFDKGRLEEDYKAISEDGITTRPNNCPALAPVECNLQIWEAFKTDARKANARLKDVSGDILKAGIILIKSLLALDQVA
ncbi:hypothetical protein E2C01_021131 [Portunus trituberculatus]|uniref:Uncharacterized protein n=1 Tax=Portunus trituberculatus TaxID=210409 RepID=A0A5B7E3E1_PORTR|nr:hypothetical protein [Portunus trituberculatus]